MRGVPNVAHLGAIARAEPSEASPMGATAYLASLTSPASRRSMRYALDQVAQVLTGDEDADLARVPWNRLRHRHMAALRSRLSDSYAPASVNTMLAAVRGVLRNAWRLGQLDTDTYLRTVDLPPVPGTRLPTGRALSAGELRALFGACADDASPAGSRDAAAFALMFGAGLRRNEAVSAQLSDYDPESGALTITGKGNRQRIVYATGGGAAALAAWLKQRGSHDGALLAPVNKGGAVQPRPMSAQAVSTDSRCDARKQKSSRARRTICGGRSFRNCWTPARTSPLSSGSRGIKVPLPLQGTTGAGNG